jgi:hypothetical protein
VGFFGNALSKKKRVKKKMNEVLYCAAEPSVLVRRQSPFVVFQKLIDQNILNEKSTGTADAAATSARTRIAFNILESASWSQG